MKLEWESATSLGRVWRGRDSDGDVVAEVMRPLGTVRGVRPWRVWLRVDSYPAYPFERARGAWSTAERAMAAAERMVGR